MEITIDDLNIDYRDEGPWRSYSLYTFGDTFSEMLMNAAITEVDQDGGELSTYGLSDAPSDVQERVEQLILGRLDAATVNKHRTGTGNNL
jgi:hypothetical protein